MLACVVLMSLYIIVKYLKYYCLPRLCYCTRYKVCLCYILDISHLSKFGFHFLLREVVCEQCYISVQYLKQESKRKTSIIYVIDENKKKYNMVPIPKRGSGSIGDIQNYRGIAWSSLLSKTFDNCVINNNQYRNLCSSDLQFAYKSQISTIHCVNSVYETINHYVSNSSAVYVCILDASKAFDRVNLLTLFEKLHKR